MAQIPLTLRTPIFHGLTRSELIDPLQIGIVVNSTVADGITLIDPIDNAEFSLQKAGTYRIGSYGVSWIGMDTKGRKGMLLDIFQYLYRLAVANSEEGHHKPLGECSKDLAILHRLPSNPHLELIFLTGSLTGEAYRIIPTDPSATWAVGIFEAPKTTPLPTQSPETLMDAPAFEQPAKIPVMLPLEQVIKILDDIRSAAFIDPSDYGDGWISALKTGIERIHETATGQPYDWNRKSEDETLDSSEQDLSLLAEPLPTMAELMELKKQIDAIPDAQDLYPYNRI